MPQVAGLRAHVVVNLAARATRSGVAHLPEIVLQAEFKDALLGHALVFPAAVRFFVARDRAFTLEDGDVELRLVDAVPLLRRNQFPPVGDGVLLEVVAEAEVAEHLEEGVVACGKADVFQVVVLAAGADAFLRSRGAPVIALLHAEEDVLELVHAGIREEKSRVIRRDEGRRMHLAVTALDKIVQELAPDFVAGKHFWAAGLWSLG